jgi:hypothetical protein
MAGYVIKSLDLEKLTKFARQQAKGDRSKIENIKKVQTLLSDESALSIERIPEDKACELLEQWK